MKANKLEIGKRYWLDRRRDVSGVYDGFEQASDDNAGEGHYFSDIQGGHGYATDQRDRVGFWGNLNFDPYEN